ncbi:MAG: cold shock domain-containing protein [Polyangiales bacterium]
MHIGLVKWFNNAKGWGFIAGEDGSDIFVHYSQISGDGYRTLRPGQHVTYDLRSGPRGQFAENVVVGEEITAAAS